MSRLKASASKEVAYPRGRPATVPYVRPEPGKKDPEPLARFNGLFFWGETPVHVIGERWHKRDAKFCSVPSYPAPDNPDHLVSMFGVDDLTGNVILAVSSEEYLARLEAIRSGTQALRPGMVRLQGT